MANHLRYKDNVAAILRRRNGEILVCERLKERGAWQFPQGGVEPGETLEQALRREVLEEIGVEATQYRVVSCKGPYRYLFGDGKTKKGFHGKEQHYFLCEFHGLDSSINLATAHPEFKAFQWILPARFEIDWLPEMKRAVYRSVFRDFFGVTL